MGKQEPKPTSPFLPGSLASITTDALATPVEQVSPDFKKSSITDNQIEKIVQTLATNFNAQPKDVVVALILLFLKGAASDGTPPTLSVEVTNKTFTKRDLISSYQLVTGNNYIRRLAEAMASTIGTYAEANGLRGELATRIETQYRGETGETLSHKELAWCSSFSQSLPDLTERSSERLVKLLAADYNKRFSANKKKKIGDKPATLNPNKGKGKRTQPKEGKDFTI